MSPPLQSIVEVLTKATAFLAKAGVESPKVDAEWLLAHCLAIPRRLDLYLQHDRPLSDAELAPYRELIRRRARREPLQQILGSAAFMDFQLQVTPAVLIPRPETELLVDLLLPWVKARADGLRIIDLGTGSGAIAIALAAALPSAKILAIDSAPDALAIARLNAERCGLRERIAFRSGNWLEGFDRTADLIVANPPYLTEAEWQAAAPEVRCFEPKSALVANGDGSADARTICEQALPRLAEGGRLAMEVGIQHPHALCAFARSLGFAHANPLRDQHQRDRFVFCDR